MNPGVFLSNQPLSLGAQTRRGGGGVAPLFAREPLPPCKQCNPDHARTPPACPHLTLRSVVARDELDTLLAHAQLGPGVPLLFLANKADLPGALSPVEIAQVGLAAVAHLLVLWGLEYILTCHSHTPVRRALPLARRCVWRTSACGLGRLCPPMR